MTRVLGVFLIVLSASVLAKAQADVKKEVVDTAAEVVTVVVSQPGCPIKIDQAYVVRLSDGKFGFIYRVQNVGKKVVKEFSMARIYSDNTGVRGPVDIKGSLRPGQFAGPYINLNPNEREALKKPSTQEGPIKRIALLMVTEIWFTDGSRFDETERFLTLQKHLELFETVYDQMSIHDRVFDRQDTRATWNQ